MRGFESQRSFVLHRSSAESSKEEIALLKKEYRSLYLKEYRRRNKGSEKKLTLRLSVIELEEIKEIAQQHSLSLNKFIVKSVIAYCGKKYLSRDNDAKELLTKSIAKIGLNINQLTQRIHYLMKIRKGFTTNHEANYEMFHKAYDLLAQEVEELKKEVEIYCDQPPPSIGSLSWEEIRTDKEKLEKLIQHLQAQKNRQL